MRRAIIMPWISTTVGSALACITLLTPIDANAEATRAEAQQQFAEEIRNRGQNPYIQHDLARDLERRIQKIVLAPVRNNSGSEFDPRTRQILKNFEDQFSYADLMQKIRLVRRGFDSMRAVYKASQYQSGCKISPNRVRMPVWDQKTKAYMPPFSWNFLQGACDSDNLAHGVGTARSSDNQATFHGLFDKGRMVEGVFSVKLPGGKVALGIGEIPGPGYIGRLLVSTVFSNGYTTHRYGDMDENGKGQGFKLIVWNYANYMIVRNVGDRLNDKIHGFAASMYKQKRGESVNWSVNIGMWKNGKLDGLGAWTNGIDWLQISEYKNGKPNGVQYGQYADVDDDTHQFEVGKRVNGKREGVWQVTASNSFGTDYWTETYRNGEEIANSIQPAFTMGQIMAFSMGAAIIGAADVPSAAKLQVGTALFQDTLGGGGGSNLAALRQVYQSRAANAQSSSSSGSSEASPTTSAGNGLTTEQHTFTCPQSGQSHTIPITYRTHGCLLAARKFAETFSCNKLDQRLRMNNCRTLCGDTRCLQK